MSSAQLWPLAERQNINADSRSGGGGSQQAGPVGFLFHAPSPLSRTARREGMHTQFRSFSNAKKTFAIRLMTICGKYYKSTVILCRKPYLMICKGHKINNNLRTYVLISEGLQKCIFQGLCSGQQYSPFARIIFLSLR